MCQNWLSIIGQCADIVGFLFIAIEWHHMFQRDVYMRQKRVERDFKKWEAERDGVPFDEDFDMEYTHWREFQRLLQKDTLYRQWLFYPSVVLVVFGFMLQAIGNWPNGIPAFGLRPC